MGQRVLVTGVARWWGALTVQRLLQEPGVDEVVGIDTEEPHHDLGEADFVRVDIRHSLIGKLVRAVGVDTVIHTQTTIDSFEDDARRAHEVNVIGTLNLLAGLAGDETPVRRVVLKSSSHVYGSDWRLPAFLGEDRPLDSSSPHSFVRDIVEAEQNLFDFGVRQRDTTVIALRLANSLNPDEPSALARLLDLPIAPTVLGYNPVIQLVHRDDCISAFVKAALAGPSGAYNIAGPDPQPLDALLDGVGKVHLPLLPPAGGSALAGALRQLGLASLTPQLYDLLRWGRTVDTSRAERALGFFPAFDTFAAFDDFVQQRRVNAFLPGGHSYVYERELEEYIHRRRTRRRRSAGLRLATGETREEAAAAPPPRRQRRPPRRS